MSSDGKKLRVYENHRTLKYKPNMFASESQFDEISMGLRKRFEPKIIFAHEIINYDAVIMSDLRVIYVDDEDMFYVGEDWDEDDDGDVVNGMLPCSLGQTEVTFYTSPAFTKKGYEVGEINHIPALAKVCVIAKKSSDNFKDKVGGRNYLSADEYNFLTT